VLLTILTRDEPRVASADRLEVEAHPLGFYRVIAIISATSA